MIYAGVIDQNKNPVSVDAFLAEIVYTTENVKVDSFFTEAVVSAEKVEVDSFFTEVVFQ